MITAMLKCNDNYVHFTDKKNEAYEAVNLLRAIQE
jgi:hypothetical protein